MTISFNKTTRFALLIIFFLSVVACDFHLRRQVSIPELLKQLVLTSDSGSPTFDRLLRIALTREGITIIDAKDTETDLLELKIKPLKISDSVLARDNYNNITQIQRQLSLTYFIRQLNNKFIYGPRTVSTTNTLSERHAEQSAKAAYNNAQTQSMSNKLASKLIYDLTYTSVK